METVAGEKKDHKVMVYTLSTCGWCKKMKALLKDLGVEYSYVDIDQAQGEEAKQVREDLKKYNPRASAPTLVIDNGNEVVIGFDEEKVRRLLANGQ
jgi:glutaredoxin